MESKITRLLITILLFVYFSVTILNAQEAIITTGKDLTGSTGTISYTIGQVAFSSIKTAAGQINQGVQQTYQIEVISGSEDFPAINLECSAYPNPTNDMLFLKVDNLLPVNLKYYLYSITGQLIKQGNIEGDVTSIKMNDCISSIYLLKVVSNKSSLKTFKIIKR